MSKDLLTIYWVTDLHILDTTNRSRPIRGLRHGILNIPEGGDRLAAFVTRVNLDRPDVVLCTGDIIDSHDYWLQKHREAQTTDGETFFEPRSSKSNACVGLSEPSKESVFFHYVSSLHGKDLAQEYFIHHSSWLKPLWTYEAEIKSADVSSAIIKKI